MSSATSAVTNRRIWLACLAIWGTASFSIAFAHVQFFTLPALREFPDSEMYLRLMHGVWHPELSAPWAYRVVVPTLASLVPASLPPHLSGSPAAASWSDSARFGLANFAFLVADGAVLFALLRRFGFDVAYAVLGTLIFYTARSTLQSGGMPTVEPGAWFCFTAALLIAVQGRALPLVPLFVVGMFVKETLLLSIPLLLASDNSRGTRARQLGAALPGVLLYFLVRFVWMRTHRETYYSFFVNTEHPSRLLHTLAVQVTSPERWLELYSAFGFLWLFAIGAYVMGEGSPLLRRWALIVPVLYVLIVLLSLDFGRILFLGFPVVIPFCLLGIRRWMVRQPVEVPSE